VAARPSCGSAGRGNWWEVFGDPDLNKLEEQVAGSNQNLKIAEARFRSARAAIRFNRAPSSQPSPLRRAPAMSRAQISHRAFRRRFKRPARAISFCPLIFPMSLTYGPRAAQRRRCRRKRRRPLLELRDR